MDSDSTSARVVNARRGTKNGSDRDGARRRVSGVDAPASARSESGGAHTQSSREAENEIALYTSQELSRLTEELEGLEHPEHENPAEHPSAVERAPSKRPRGAKRNRARESRGVAASEASETSTTERDVAPSEHARTVDGSTEHAALAAEWRAARERLDRAIVRGCDSSRPVYSWHADEAEWKSAQAAFSALDARVREVSALLATTLQSEWDVWLAAQRASEQAPPSERRKWQQLAFFWRGGSR